MLEVVLFQDVQRQSMDGVAFESAMIFREAFSQRRSSGRSCRAGIDVVFTSYAKHNAKFRTRTLVFSKVVEVVRSLQSLIADP